VTKPTPAPAAAEPEAATAGEANAADGTVTDAATDAEKAEEEKAEDSPLATDIVDQAQAEPELEPTAQPGEDGEREAAEGSALLNTSSSNGWLVVILIILVLVVLGLVGYATNMMAKNKKELPANPRRHKNNGAKAAAAAATYEDDEEDIDDEEEDDDTTEVDQLRNEVSQLKQQLQHHNAAAPAAAATATGYAPGRRTLNQPRIIYLSQANANGVFLRADASYNMGNSIFKLVTSDGYSGSFTVIDDPTVHELALMMPVDFLINACTGKNLQLAGGARRIVNDSTGTAVFENGRWRVSRKAQIHYAN
jgi:hypothetical protein